MFYLIICLINNVRLKEKKHLMLHVCPSPCSRDILSNTEIFKYIYSGSLLNAFNVHAKICVY